MITFSYPYTSPTDTVTLGGEKDAENRELESYQDMVETEDGKKRTYQTGPTQGYATGHTVRFWLNEDAALNTSNLSAVLSFITDSVRFGKYPFKFTDEDGDAHRVRLMGSFKYKYRAGQTDVEVTLEEDFA